MLADSTEIVRGIPESVADMRKAIRNTKALTDKPFGINVFPEAGDPYGFSKAMIELAKEEGVMILVVAGNVSPDEIRQWKADGFTHTSQQAQQQQPHCSASMSVFLFLPRAVSSTKRWQKPRRSSAQRAYSSAHVLFSPKNAEPPIKPSRIF